MSIKKTIIVTVAIAASVAMVAPMLAGATTVTDMMAQISALQAQLSALQGGTPVPTGGVLCQGVTFTRNLVVGSTGSDVKCLQVLLNTNGYTLAATGAGSPGHETSYFGPRTLVVVKAFQAAKGMVPANQVGPLTRAALNALLGSGTYVPPVTILVPGCTTTSASAYSITNGENCATGVVIQQQSGTISAQLASSTPSAGAIVSGQATAGLLDINFTGTGVVTSVTLQRSGISDQNTLTNVYLFDGNTRITDGYSFNVSGQIVMNGLSIAVNGSHTISVKADVLSTAYSTASTIAVALTGYTANSSTMSANVMGNTQTIVVGSLATAYLGTNTVYTSGATPAVNAGTTQYTVWSAPLQINTRAVMLKTANFRMVGSAPSNALANIRMFIDGVDTGKVATVITISGSNYASFDLTSAPITLTTGSHTMDVRADIVSGAARTVQLSVQQASDLTILDPQIGVNIAVLGASGVAFTANAGANVNINQGSGSVVVDPTFTSATNISAGATNAVIGRFVITGYGEDVKINSINVEPELSAEANTTVSGALVAETTAQDVTVASNAGFVAGNIVTSSGNSAVGTINSLTGTTGMNITFATNPTTAASQTLTVADKGLNNVTLYFNGSQIGSTQSPTSATSTVLAFNLGSQMIVSAGTNGTLEVRADLQGSNNVAYGAGTIKVKLPAEATNNAQGQSSQNSLKVPAGDVETTGLTISSATLAVSKNTAFTSQTFSPNTSNVKIGSFIVQNQSTSESVRLTTLTVNLVSDVGNDALSASMLTGITSLRTSDTTGSGSTPIQPSAANTFSINDTLAPGASMVIDILANMGSTSTLPTVITRLTVASIGTSSNISSAGTIQTGQTMSSSTGSLEIPSLIVSSTTPSQYIASGANGAANSSQVTYNFVSDAGASIINELKFGVIQGTGSVTNVCVGSICAQPVSGVADLTGLNLQVLNNGGLAQNVQVSYAPVGTYGLDSAQASQISLIYVKYQSGGTTSVACATSVALANSTTYTCTHTDTNNVLTGSTGVVSPVVALVGSVPTVTVPSTVATGLILGAVNQIGQVIVAANAQGAIRIHTIAFAVGGSGFDTTNTMTIGVGTVPTLDIGSTPITGSLCAVTNSTTVTCTFTGSYSTDFIISAGQSQTFNLYAKVGGSQYAGSKASVSTSVTASTFVWDDSSWNGTSYGTNLKGQDASYATNAQTIYNWPSNSYSVSQ